MHDPGYTAPTESMYLHDEALARAAPRAMRFLRERCEDLWRILRQLDELGLPFQDAKVLREEFRECEAALLALMAAVTHRKAHVRRPPKTPSAPKKKAAPKPSAEAPTLPMPGSGLPAAAAPPKKRGRPKGSKTKTRAAALAAPAAEKMTGREAGEYNVLANAWEAAHAGEPVDGGLPSFAELRKWHATQTRTTGAPLPSDLADPPLSASQVEPDLARLAAFTGAAS